MQGKATGLTMIRHTQIRHWDRLRILVAALAQEQVRAPGLGLEQALARAPGLAQALVQVLAREQVLAPRKHRQRRLFQE